MTDQSRSAAVDSDDEPGQLTDAAQTHAAAVLLCAIAGIPFLFGENHRLAAGCGLVSFVFIVGCGLLISRRTRSWGWVVTAVAVTVYMCAGLLYLIERLS